MATTKCCPPIYRKIIWNNGDLCPSCLCSDAHLLYNWIDQMALTGGIYFSGDDLAEEWATCDYPDLGAIALRTAYCDNTVLNGDHMAYGLETNPKVVGVVEGIFSHVDTPDSMIAYGGCPSINDFDVLSGSDSVRVEMNYHPYYSPVPPTGGAIVSQTTLNSHYPDKKDVTIVLSGSSYHYIRDYDNDGIVDRYHHMHDIITALDNDIPEPVAVRPEIRRNSLAQNYPNPFNPTTTIKYTIKEKAHVSLKIYNVAGQLVKTLIDEVQSPDRVAPVEWRGLNNAGQRVASGVYFYKLVTKDFTRTKKLVLLK